MKSPNGVERAMNSILQQIFQDKTGTGRPKSRGPEMKGSCNIFPLEKLHKRIIYLEGKVQGFKRCT